MPRQARILSTSGMYHVVIRGIDRQIIFYDEQDYLKYLDILNYYKKECDFNILAYCLMTNHIHLVIQTNQIPLHTIFHKINTRYAVWFNLKYERVGHLQQERYYSEPIEDIDYLVNVIRYVHNNPLKAGLEKERGSTYPWNSIHEYRGGGLGLADIMYVLKIISCNIVLDYTDYEVCETIIDVEKRKNRVPDDVAKEILFRITDKKTLSDAANLPLSKQKEVVLTAHKYGLSTRQISRLTGIPRGFASRTVDSVSAD